MFLIPFIAGITTLTFGAGHRIVPAQCKEELQAGFLNEQAKPDELTALRQALLGIVNDSSLKIAIRADAAKEIGRIIDLKDAEIGKRLASVLSGDVNKLNLEICILLQTYKVPGVTPKIKKLAEKASDESDPICKAIADAIVNCSKETEKKDQHEEVSAVSNWLLLIAESKRIERELRIKALYEIGRIGEIASVPRLLRLLPGDTKGGDEETIAALDALASIGAPQVVSFLEKLDKTNDFHGRVRVALGSAIEKCSKGKTLSSRIRLLIRALLPSVWVTLGRFSDFREHAGEHLEA
jgi:hypothetical protein